MSLCLKTCKRSSSLENQKINPKDIEFSKSKIKKAFIHNIEAKSYYALKQTRSIHNKFYQIQGNEPSSPRYFPENPWDENYYKFIPKMGEDQISINDSIHRVTCGSCNGHGQHSSKCGVCSGTGQIKKTRIISYGTFTNPKHRYEDYYEPCGHCNHGRVYTRCSNCSGSGQLRSEHILYVDTYEETNFKSFDSLFSMFDNLNYSWTYANKLDTTQESKRTDGSFVKTLESYSQDAKSTVCVLITENEYGEGYEIWDTRTGKLLIEDTESSPEFFNKLIDISLSFEKKDFSEGYSKLESLRKTEFLNEDFHYYEKFLGNYFKNLINKSFLLGKEEKKSFESRLDGNFRYSNSDLGGSYLYYFTIYPIIVLISLYFLDYEIINDLKRFESKFYGFWFNLHFSIYVLKSFVLIGGMFSFLHHKIKNNLLSINYLTFFFLLLFLNKSIYFDVVKANQGFLIDYIDPSYFYSLSYWSSFLMLSVLNYILFYFKHKSKNRKELFEKDLEKYKHILPKIDGLDEFVKDSFDNNKKIKEKVLVSLHKI